MAFGFSIPRGNIVLISLISECQSTEFGTTVGGGFWCSLGNIVELQTAETVKGATGAPGCPPRPGRPAVVA